VTKFYQNISAIESQQLERKKEREREREREKRICAHGGVGSDLAKRIKGHK
jgi:hypothetical protein